MSANDLIRLEPRIGYKITAHPADFAEFLSFVSSEDFEWTCAWFVWVEEGGGVVHFFV
jgi:hypothetical protein